MTGGGGGELIVVFGVVVLAFIIAGALGAFVMFGLHWIGWLS